MIIQFAIKLARLIQVTILTTLLTAPVFLCSAQTAPSEPLYSIVERGAFYRVLQQTISVTNSGGVVSQQVQGYTDSKME